MEDLQWFSDWLLKHALTDVSPLSSATSIVSQMLNDVLLTADITLELAALRSKFDELKLEVQDKETKLQKLTEKIQLAETRAMFVLGPKDDKEAAIAQATKNWPDSHDKYVFDIYISHSPEFDSAIANQIYLFLQLYPNLNPYQKTQLDEKHKDKVFLGEQGLQDDQ
ncbi:hypothetical protein HK096_006151, partial [Nowakowskiella sp. JEL0078]